MGAGVRKTSVEPPAAPPPLETPVYFKSFKAETMRNKWDDEKHQSE